MNKDARTKLLAVMAAAIMVGCVLYAAMPQEEVQESDAILGIDDVLFASVVVSFIIGIVSGFLLGVAYATQPNGDKLLTRNNESASVADSVYLGMQYYENTLRNYCQLWSLTDEHWIRQAEIATSFSWAKDQPLDITRVLTDSGVYLNSSQMLTNATAEVNDHFRSMSERLDWYNTDTTDTYKDHMKMGWTYGTNSFASKTAFGGEIGGLISPTSEYKKAYISGTGVNGKMYVFGGASTIKSSAGTVYNLAEGANDLSSLGVQPGVYEFQDGRQYLSGSLLRISDPAACAVKAGMMLQAGSAMKLATFKAGSTLAESRIIIDGVQYDDLLYSITPDGGTPHSQSIKKGFYGINSLISEINRTTSHAVSSAAAVHSIYTRAGQASTYITTLMVPNNYHNVEMSQEQKAILTILSLEQLSKYWQESGGKIKTGEYKMTDASMQLYCRGDIYDKAGTTKLYSNVIFSPYYYQHGITLQEGVNVPDQYCIAGIWAQGVSALSGWSSASIDNMYVVAMDKGQKIDIYEMYYNGAPVTSKTLDVTAVTIIDPSVIDPHPLPPVDPVEPGETNWAQVIMYIVGAMLLLFGAYSRQPVFILVGAIVILLGYVAGGLINDLIMGKSLWHWVIGGAL